MALNTFAALCIIIYYMVLIAMGVVSGRRLNHSEAATRHTTGAFRRTGRLFWRSAAVDDTDDFLERFFVCDRKMPLILGFASMTATWVGGGYLNGSAEAVYQLGLIHCQAPFGYAVSLLLGGAYFAGRLQDSNSITMLDPFQRRYGKWISLILLPPAVCGEMFWTAAVFAALGSTVQVIVELDANVAIIVSASVTFFYTSLGGLYSISHTDAFQLTIVGLGLWTCVPFCLWSKALGQVPAPDNDWRGKISLGDIGQIFDVFATTALGGIPWQVYFERILASGTVFNAKMMSYLAAFGCIVLAVPPMVIGAAAKTANFTAVGYAGSHRLNEQDIGAVLPFAIRYLTPSVVSIIGLGAITSAVMSSADSSVLSIASLISKNVYYTILRPRASGNEMAIVVRAMVCVVGVAATIMALSVQSVYALWSLSADVVYVMLFPQLMCLFYMQRTTNTYGLISGVLVGVVSRALCGEPSMSVPVVVKLPLYDEQLGMQKFPHRTLCMSLNLLTTVASSALWEKLFAWGIMPKSLDCCRCFVPADQSQQQSAVAMPEKKALDVKSATAMPPKSRDATPADTCEDATSHETKVSPRWKVATPSSMEPSRTAPERVATKSATELTPSNAAPTPGPTDELPPQPPKLKPKRSKISKTPKKTI